LVLFGENTSKQESVMQFNFLMRIYEENYAFLISQNDTLGFRWKKFKIDHLEYGQPEPVKRAQKIDLNVIGFIGEQRYELLFDDLMFIEEGKWKLTDRIVFQWNMTKEEIDQTKSEILNSK